MFRNLDIWISPNHTWKVTISLAKDVEEFLKKQVEAGVCTDASEFVDHILRSYREQQRQPLDVTPELEAWLLDAADQSVTPLTGKDFDDIRKRAWN